MEQISYVDQVSCYLIKNCDLYRGTNKQTNKQTDKQMKGQSEIAYLPKFANIMLIVMVIVINEIF